MGGLYEVPPALARQRAERLLSLFELADKADDLVESYSHGMRQKLALAGRDAARAAGAVPGRADVGARSAQRAAGQRPAGRRWSSAGTPSFCRRTCSRSPSTCAIASASSTTASVIATGTLDELRHQAQREAYSLEDIFLQLTGGSEERELAAYLRS